MSLVGLVKTLAIGGVVAGTVGISGIIAGSSTPPPASNLDSEESYGEKAGLESETQSSDSSSDSSHSSSGSQQRSGGNSSAQERGDQSQQRGDSVSTNSGTSPQAVKHCLVVLTGQDSDSKQKIIVCSESQNHLEIKKDNKWGVMKWYLYDSARNTLDEISGLLMNNERPQRLWYWVWWQDFYRWYSSGDHFWKRDHWTPYFEDSDGKITTFDVKFNLPFEESEFGPIYRRLSEYYSTRCGWNAYATCSKFKVTKSRLSTYLSELPHLETKTDKKICLTLKDSNGLKKIWTTKTPCPTSSQK